MCLVQKKNTEVVNQQKPFLRPWLFPNLAFSLTCFLHPGPASPEKAASKTESYANVVNSLLQSHRTFANIAPWTAVFLPVFGAVFLFRRTSFLKRKGPFLSHNNLEPAMLLVWSIVTVWEGVIRHPCFLKHFCMPFTACERRFQAAKFRRAATEYDFQCQRRCACQCVLAPKNSLSLENA